MQEMETPKSKAEAKKVSESPSPPPSVEAHHPYDFHVCGPRNLPSPNWKDLIKSSWKDPKYKRMVIACFIQAVYLLELDRQDKRSGDGGLAQKWWMPFKFKLTKTLVDERDGSIYGAILEWDRSAAISNFVLMRPSGAPRAVLALRGTLLKGPTIRRDLADDLRFFAWESLRGSVRFNGALEGLRSLVQSFGSANVCVGGHSLGPGFALQVGKALAKEGVFVESHLFNPPSVSLAMTARSLWNRVRAAMPSSNAAAMESEEEKRILTEIKKWVPTLYVNSSDYICCYYTDSGEAEIDGASSKGNGEVAAAKLFVMAKGPQRFLEAHGLEQWWADDIELQVALNHSKLINRQLRSLYPALQNSPVKNQ